jgi:hypothetical protein
VIGARILRRLLGGYVGTPGEEVINDYDSAAPDTPWRSATRDSDQYDSDGIITERTPANELNDDHVWDDAHETNYQKQKRQEENEK